MRHRTDDRATPSRLREPSFASSRRRSIGGAFLLAAPLAASACHGTVPPGDAGLTVDGSSVDAARPSDGGDASVNDSAADVVDANGVDGGDASANDGAADAVDASGVDGGDASANDSAADVVDATGVDATIAPVDAAPVDSSTTPLDAAPSDSGLLFASLTCDEWLYAEPVDLGSGCCYSFGSSPSATTARFFQQADTQAIEIHELDLSVTPPTWTGVTTGSTALRGLLPIYAIRLHDGFGIVMQTEAQGTPQLVIYVVPDSMPLSPPVPEILAPSYTESAYPPALVEVSPSQYFVAYTNTSQAGVGHTLVKYDTVYWGTVGTPSSSGIAGGAELAVPFDISRVEGGLPDCGAYQIQGALAVDSQPWLFLTSPPLPPSCSPETDGLLAPGYWSYSPSTGEQQLTADGGGWQIVDSVSGSAPETVNVAYADSNPLDGGATLGIGQFATSVFTPATLPGVMASAPAGLLDWTGSALEHRFFGDDFVVLELGAGVDFFWYDVHGLVRASIPGLIPDASSIMDVTAWPGPRTATTAAWNFLWSERPDGGSSSDVFPLKYNQLRCRVTAASSDGGG